MKLPIKDRFFKQIKAGKKDWEYRDAHITFVNEKTGEHLRRNIKAVNLMEKKEVTFDSEEEKCFDTDELIRFALE